MNRLRISPTRHLLSLLLLAMSLTYLHATTTPSTSVSNRSRAVRDGSFNVALPLDRAFELFEPVGEQNWVPGWKPVFLTTTDARLHNGSVFTVTRHHPEGGTPIESVWSVIQYDPPNVIAYQNVLIGLRATRITVRCEAIDAGNTRVHVRYLYNSLSDAGDRELARITDESFAAMMKDWPKLIAEYIERGTPATR